MHPTPGSQGHSYFRWRDPQMLPTMHSSNYCALILGKNINIFKEGPSVVGSNSKSGWGAYPM
jgi:hypothetical protein